MDISSIATMDTDYLTNVITGNNSNKKDVDNFISALQKNYLNNSVAGVSEQDTDNTGAFQSLLNSAMGMVSDTNTLINKAEEEVINYTLGYNDDPHTVAVAQQKANVSLQYTVAVRNKVLEAYKEIMNIQM